MNRTEKTSFYRIICVLLVLTLLGTPAAGLRTLAAGGSSMSEIAVAPRKIISVVFDDSGSMRSTDYGMNAGRWVYAAYALEAFASLLGERDEMYITYMNDMRYQYYTPVQVDLTNVQKSVDEIRAYQTGFMVPGGSTGTPIEAMTAAMQKLESIQETDPNTQFWLVIISDGTSWHDENGSAQSLSFVEKRLHGKDYKGKKMSNGSQLYISYLGIGSETSIREDPANGLDAVSTTDVVGTLTEIADRISGRTRYTSSEVTFTDSQTAQVRSDLPLYNLSVFSQRSSATVTAAEVSGQSGSEALTADRNISLRYPEATNDQDGDYLATDTSLYGNAALITDSSQVIPAGTYTIHFSEPVQAENVVIMYQPAIRVEITVSKDGVVIDDPDSLRDGETVDVDLTPISAETGQEIDESLLPAGTAWTITYTDADGKTKTENGRSLSGLTVKEGENILEGVMDIPDLAPVSQAIVVNGVKKPGYELHESITQNGAAPSAELISGDTVDIAFALHYDNGGAQIPEADIPAGSTWTLTYTSADGSTQTAAEPSMTGLVLAEGGNTVECVLQMPGEAPVSKTVTITAGHRTVYGAQIVLLQEGDPLDDPDSLCDGDVFDARVVVTDAETGKEIPEKEIPEGTAIHLSYTSASGETASGDTEELTGLPLREGVNTVTCTLEVPGQDPVQAQAVLNGQHVRVWGIETIQPQENESVYKRSGMGKGKAAREVTFWITDQGQRLSKEELGKEKLTITGVRLEKTEGKGLLKYLNVLSIAQADLQLKQNDDGSFTLYPSHVGYIGVPPAFLIAPGKYTAEIELSAEPGITAEGTLTVTGRVFDWWPVPAAVLLALILLYLFYLIFVKPKFNGQYVNIEVYKARIGGDGEGVHLVARDTGDVLKRYPGILEFFSPKGSKKVVDEVLFEASGQRSVIISGETIRQFDSFGSSLLNPETSFAGVVGQLTETTEANADQIPKRQKLDSNPFYLKSGRLLYKITVER